MNVFSPCTELALHGGCDYVGWTCGSTMVVSTSKDRRRCWQLGRNETAPTPTPLLLPEWAYPDRGGIDMLPHHVSFSRR